MCIRFLKFTSDIEDIYYIIPSDDHPNFVCNVSGFPKVSIKWYYQVYNMENDERVFVKSNRPNVEYN